MGLSWASHWPINADPLLVACGVEGGGYRRRGVLWRGDGRGRSRTARGLLAIAGHWGRMSE